MSPARRQDSLVVVEARMQPRRPETTSGNPREKRSITMQGRVIGFEEHYKLPAIQEANR